jgi:hypothetical protein
MCVDHSLLECLPSDVHSQAIEWTFPFAMLTNYWLSRKSGYNYVHTRYLAVVYSAGTECAPMCVCPYFFGTTRKRRRVQQLNNSWQSCTHLQYCTVPMCVCRFERNYCSRGLNESLASHNFNKSPQYLPTIP